MDSIKVNDYFKEMAGELGLMLGKKVEIPNIFIDGTIVFWNEIIENMMVVLEAKIDLKLMNFPRQTSGPRLSLPPQDG